MNTRQSFPERARTSRRGEDWLRLQACVSCYCTTFRRPVEPFQHQQSPGQKTNLASQGLSVKKGCLGCKRNWNCLPPPLLGEGWEDELSPRRTSRSLTPTSPRVVWSSSESRILHQTLMKNGLRHITLRLQSSPKAMDHMQVHQRMPACLIDWMCQHGRMGSTGQANTPPNRLPSLRSAFKSLMVNPWITDLKLKPPKIPKGNKLVLYIRKARLGEADWLSKVRKVSLGNQMCTSIWFQSPCFDQDVAGIWKIPYSTAWKSRLYDASLAMSCDRIPRNRMVKLENGPCELVHLWAAPGLPRMV